MLLRTQLAQDAGVTLVELLVACSAALVVFGAMLALLHSSVRVQARDSKWALMFQEDRAGLTRMAHDIRQASTVEEATTGAISLRATVNGKSWRIKYTCASNSQCVRLAAEGENALPTSGPAIATSVLNGSTVFAYSPNTTSPSNVTIKIELPAQGSLKQVGSSGYTHKVVLESSAFMRNLYPAG